MDHKMSQNESAKAFDEREKEREKARLVAHSWQADMPLLFETIKLPGGVHSVNQLAVSAN